MGALIVSSLIAIAAANVLWWWYRGREQAYNLRVTRQERDLARKARSDWEKRARVAEATLWDATQEITSLRDKNEMLTYLGGKVASSWPTP